MVLVVILITPSRCIRGWEVSDCFSDRFAGAVAGLMPAAAGGEDDTRHGVFVYLEEGLSADRTADRDHFRDFSGVCVDGRALGHGWDSSLLILSLSGLPDV